MNVSQMGTNSTIHGSRLQFIQVETAYVCLRQIASSEYYLLLVGFKNNQILPKVIQHTIQDVWPNSTPSRGHGSILKGQVNNGSIGDFFIYNEQYLSYLSLVERSVCSLSLAS